jgi:uncharacterized membrane protein (DUF4010 family)
MDPQELYLRFFTALAIGLAIGIERGWKQRHEKSGEREAGIRTFTLFALTGFAAGVAAEPLGTTFVAIIAVGIFTLVSVGYISDVMRDDADRGMTTEVAALLTFVLGALCAVGAVLPAAIIGVIAVALLDQKDLLHGFVQRLQKLELTAAVKLLLISVVLLPVLPNEGYGPGGVLNPYELWWAVVIVAALGLVGYAAIKIAGTQRGALLMGLLGGLLSSTGVTVSAARASQGTKAAALPLASAIATAQAVMFVRTGVLISALNAALLDFAILPLALGAITAIAGALIVTHLAQKTTQSEAFDAGSPDTLNAAIKFIVIVAAMLLLAHYAQAYAGEIGLILSGLLSGAVDVDAATVSASRLSGSDVHEASAAAGAASIAVAITANSFVKSGIAYSLGTRELARPAIAVLVSSGIAALLGAGIAYMWSPH